MTYPNILVLDYLKRSGKATPELRMKAEQYLNLGYQRLLTFRNRDGGFNAGANKIPQGSARRQFNRRIVKPVSE